MTEDVVPDFFRRLWRLPTSPQRRGRKSELTVDAVVGAAVDLADSGGLEAATLPKVAAELNVTPMSLYRHVGSKQELLQLMMDAASEPVAAEVPSWREGLHLWARDLWTLYRQRPWLPRVPIYRAPSGPHQIAWLERGFTCLASTGLGWRQQLAALNLLSGYVRQTALLQGELEEGRDGGQALADSEREYGAALNRVVSEEDFPRTAEMLSADSLGTGTAEGDGTTRQEGPADSPGADRDFVEGLEVILDGLATRIAHDDDFQPAKGSNELTRIRDNEHLGR